MQTIGFEIKRKCKVCGKVAWKRKKDVKDRNAKLEAIA